MIPERIIVLNPVSPKGPHIAIPYDTCPVEVYEATGECYELREFDDRPLACYTKLPTYRSRYKQYYHYR